MPLVCASRTLQSITLLQYPALLANNVALSYGGNRRIMLS